MAIIKGKIKMNKTVKGVYESSDILSLPDILCLVKCLLLARKFSIGEEIEKEQLLDKEEVEIAEKLFKSYTVDILTAVLDQMGNEKVDYHEESNN